MNDNYWNCKDLIPATEEEKEAILNYEIWMFKETCDRFNSFTEKAQFERNLLVESLATHVRILIDFFYRDNDRKYPNDLLAQDFLSDTVIWKDIRPEESGLLADAKNKADKQLAHLSLWRIKIEKDGRKGWNRKAIREEMEKVIEKFEEAKRKVEEIIDK